MIVIKLKTKFDWKLTGIPPWNCHTDPFGLSLILFLCASVPQGICYGKILLSKKELLVI